MITLSDYLGAAYAAQMMGRGSVADVMATFKIDAGDNPDLMMEAQALLATLDDGICDRDIISKCQRDFLTAALS